MIASEDWKHKEDSSNFTWHQRKQHYNFNGIILR